MSDIRFNQWLHQSGTGGVSQVDGGHVGIGTTNPDIAVHTANAKKLNVGIVTANSIYAGNFYGSGSNLTGVGHVDKIIEGDTKVEVFDAGSQYISAEVNGSEKVRIDSSGRLLIGDTDTNNAFSGGDDLVIGNTDSGSRSGITIVSNSAQDGGLYFSKGTSSDQVRGQIVYQHDSNGGYMRFYTNADERLRITSDGKFGFGTASPDQTVHIHKGSAGSIDSTATSVLTLENSTTAVLQFLTPNTAAAQLRFGDPQDNGAGFIDYSHNSNTMSFGVYGPTRMQIDSNGHLGINVASTTQLANSAMLTLRPTDGDGIRFIRPGDTNNSPSTHMDLTTSTSGSTYRNGGDAYLLRLNSYNNDLEFRSYLDGGTGGIIRLRTHDGANGSIRYWQMDEKGVTTHRSRSTVVKTHEFTYTGGAGGGTLNVNLLSISGYSASSTAVVEIKYVGMYGLAGSYISQGIWLCSYRRANGGSAANALAQQTHNSGSNSASNVTMAWVGDNLRLTVGAFTGFTVHVTATVYNATINVLV